VGIDHSKAVTEQERATNRLTAVRAVEKSDLTLAPTGNSPNLYTKHDTFVRLSSGEGELWLHNPQQPHHDYSVFWGGAVCPRRRSIQISRRISPAARARLFLRPRRLIFAKITANGMQYSWFPRDDPLPETL
jgi:hypothetical protein